MSGFEIFGKRYSAKKCFREGTHRSRTPAETLAALRPLLGRFGITRLANITGLDFIGIPVFVAINPTGRSLATSQGKGLDADAARVSALMESIESWHAEYLDRPLRFESFNYLRRAVGPDCMAIDPNDLPRMRPVDPNVPQKWIEGWDLLSNRPCWVPYDAVTLNGVGLPFAGTELVMSSNGLASGNHLLEAIVHGLCEIVERDAEYLWRLTDSIRQIDNDSIGEGYCREVLRRLDAAGVAGIGWDLTNDIGIPVCGFAVMETPNRGELRSYGVSYGFGCHLDPMVALSRAMTEAVQTRLSYISGSRDDFLREDYEMSRDPGLLKAIWDEVSSNESKCRLDMPSLATDTFEGDLTTILHRIKAAGAKAAAVVDLTLPNVGISVAKVVVPGLEGPGGKILGVRAQQIIGRKNEH